MKWHPFGILITFEPNDRQCHLQVFAVFFTWSITLGKKRPNRKPGVRPPSPWGFKLERGRLHWYNRHRTWRYPLPWRWVVDNIEYFDASQQWQLLIGDPDYFVRYLRLTWDEHPSDCIKAEIHQTRLNYQIACLPKWVPFSSKRKYVLSGFIEYTVGHEGFTRRQWFNLESPHAMIHFPQSLLATKIKADLNSLDNHMSITP